MWFIDKILKDVKEKRRLTAKKAWNMTQYSKFVDNIDTIAKDKIQEIETYIEYKITHNNSQTSITIDINNNQKEVYELVKQHFIGAGFFVKTIEIPELKDNNEHIIISWYNPS